MKTDAATDADREEALRFLRSHFAMTLSTSGAAGPWASVLFYAAEGFTLYFMTWPDKRPIANLSSDPLAAATVVEESGSVSTSRCLQLAGRVEQVASPAEAATGRALLAARLAHAGAASLLRGRDAAEALKLLAGAALYRLSVERAWYTDNSRGMGRRVVMDCR